MDRETCNPEELPSPLSICVTESGPMPQCLRQSWRKSRRSLPPLNELIRYQQQCEKKNSLGKCLLMSEKELNKSGRDSFDYCTDVFCIIFTANEKSR